MVAPCVGGVPGAPKAASNWAWKYVSISEAVLFPAAFHVPKSKTKSFVEALSTVRVRVSVELGETSKTIKEVYGLGEGSIVQLDKLAGEPLDVLANGVLIAKGETVVIDENFGVRITEIVGDIDSFEETEEEPAAAV